MRTILLLILLLCTTGLVSAQEPYDYWEGDGKTMTDIAWGCEVECHYLRFTEFPVKVWSSDTDGFYLIYLQAALAELNKIIPMQLVADPAQADIQLNFNNFMQLKLNVDAVTGISFIQTNGVWDFKQITFVVFDKFEWGMCTLLLHELLHGLGLGVHSPHAEDILYPRIGAKPCMLTQRDINTVWRLYNNPAATFDEIQVMGELHAQQAAHTNPITPWCQRDVAHTLTEESFKHYCPNETYRGS